MNHESHNSIRAVSDHFVDANKMIQTAPEPCFRRREDGHFANFNSLDFEGIKTITAVHPQP
jgi:hypothetical protein